MPEASLACLQDAVHVWLARPERCSLPQLLERYETLLSEEERQRCQRFHFENDRKHFLAAHALLRLTLAHYLECHPQELIFANGPNGKPRLLPPPGKPPLRFNLSHTRGMVACVLSLEHECGIDVEGIRAMKHLEGVAETVFSPEELAYLEKAGVADATRLPVFFTLWTLKEAYIKATGLGMSAPLQKISIDPVTLRVKDESRPMHESPNWLFDSWQPAPGHALALACDGPATIRTIVYQEFDLADGSLQFLKSTQLAGTAE